MFCENCGKPIPDGARLCDQCREAPETTGAPSAPNPQEADVLAAALAPETSAPVTPSAAAGEATTFALGADAPTPTAKSRSKKPVVLAVLGVVLVAVVALAILFWSDISRFFKHTFTDPADYLVQTERSAMSCAIDRLCAETNGQSAQSGQGLRMELGVDPALAGQGLPFESLVVELGAAWQDAISRTYMSMGFNGQLALTLDVTTDMENQRLYLSVPQLSDQALEVDLGEILGEDATSVLEGLTGNTAFVGMEPLTEAELRQFMTTYSELLLKHYRTVSLETETLTASGVSQKVSALTVSFTEKQLADLSTELLQTLQADPLFVERLPEGITAEGLFDQDLEVLATCTGTEVALTMTVYVDDDDTIVGRRFTADGDSFACYTTRSGSDTGFCIDLGQLRIDGSGQEADGKHSGEYYLSSDNTRLLCLRASDVTDSSGKLRLGLQPAFLEAMENTDLLDGLEQATLVLESLALELEWDEQNAHLAFTAMGMEILYLDLSPVNQAELVAAVPENAVSISDYLSFAGWLADLDLEGFMESLTEAGLPEDLVEELLESILDEIL